MFCLYSSVSGDTCIWLSFSCDISQSFYLAWFYQCRLKFLILNPHFCCCRSLIYWQLSLSLTHQMPLMAVMEGEAPHCPQNKHSVGSPLYQVSTKGSIWTTFWTARCHVTPWSGLVILVRGLCSGTCLISELTPCTQLHNFYICLSVYSFRGSSTYQLSYVQTKRTVIPNCVPWAPVSCPQNQFLFRAPIPPGTTFSRYSHRAAV